MKALALSEVFEKLSENEALEFEWINCSEYSDEPLYIGYKNKNILHYYNKSEKIFAPLGFSKDIIQHAKFIVINQPVDFMTAFNSGKKIKSEHCAAGYLTPYQFAEIFYTLDEDVLLKMINGKWFVECNFDYAKLSKKQMQEAHERLCD